ncbi:MAG: tetratricopeptide repeat protein [Bacteroides sp.]|nr:tetratricopeptide repeat protein [Bacteroides sp.]MCM1413321.1 tetratricopeptide repeat protein [Bacteroides sp.]MCM1471993.1 tetratricopeptide repeat protein [Bacteroides sp.]
MLTKHLTSLIVALLISLAGFAAHADEKEYYDLTGQADKAANEGRWADAESLLRQAMRLDPSNPGNVLLMSNLGMIQFYDGRTDEALATLNDARRIAPASVTILLNLARVLTSAGRRIEALDDYSEAIRLDSTIAEPRFYRAMILISNGEIVKAKADIDTLLLQHPDDRLTAVAQSTILTFNGAWQEAIPWLTKVIDLEPDASYYGQRALCRLMTGDVSGAAEDISAGLELDPVDGDLYLYRAMLNKMRFRPDDARADGETAIKFGVDPAKVKALI